MVNAKVTEFINAVVSKISTLISTHNTSSSAHNDIRNLVSAKADITQSITNGDTTHSPSGDAVYDALSVKSDTGHTHTNYVATSDSRLTNARTPTSHSHGSLANGGTLNSDITSVNKIAVTDSSNNLKTISQLPYSKISGTPSLSSSSSVEVTNPVTLPSEYTQLNYIEGNHSQYLDTGWKFNNTYPTKIECKFMPYDTLGVSGYGIPYGLQTASYSNWIYPFYMNNNNFNLHIGGSAGVDAIPISFRSVYDTVFIINNGSWSRTINNVTTTGSYTGSIDTGSNLFILGGSYGANALNQMSGRIYSMKITVGSNLVRNYIPVRRNSDNKCGLYDLVNNNFIVSNGGDVTGGDVVKDTTLSASVSVNNLPNHTHNYSDLNNTGLVEFLVEYTDGTTETIKVLKYTGT